MSDECDHPFNINFVRRRRLITRCELCGYEVPGDKISEKDRRLNEIPRESDISITETEMEQQNVE